MKKNDKLRQKAISLRQSGKSYKDISKILNVNLSNISYWLKNVVISDEDKRKLACRNPANKEFNGIRFDVGQQSAINAKNLRLKYQNEGYKSATEFNLHLVGCMLY